MISCSTEAVAGRCSVKRVFLEQVAGHLRATASHRNLEQIVFGK